MPQGIDVEIVVQDPAGVRIANDAGATRVELCTALGVGGLSPSISLIERCVAQGLPVHVLIRPRPGGFVYTDEEKDLIRADIAASVRAGAAGVVIGALDTKASGLDMAALETWIAAADGGDVTIHRCVDVLLETPTTSPEAVGDALISLGVTRVLTSGGATTVGRGLATIDALSRYLNGKVQVMAGGGTQIEDIAPLRAIGVAAVHLSARMTSHAAGPAGPGGGDGAFDVTNPDLVRAAVRAATQ
ncbi:copper homeostasis protein CutC [Stomatohabitans albus]|uniref:copper homeostasis protein CutC n=1 Tax=Stomatohabitans albus TaxID=3110766 RepID=UPI00300CBC38